MNANNTNNPDRANSVDTYFAASNSGIGFVSYFDRIFDNTFFDRIYILKGGPGTGKSSLMKNAATKAKELGFPYECILCSSDPSSLDGVIIYTDKGKRAIIDGTAPHTRDTQTPGAIDEIIDLGAFWNDCTLTENRSTIMMHQKKKKEAYTTAYNILSCAHKYNQRKRQLLSSCIQEQKLEKSIKRILSSLPIQNKEYSETYKLKSAISTEGPFTCNTYKSGSKKAIAVYGSHGANFAVFSTLYSMVKYKDIPITLSPSPLSPEIWDAMVIGREISLYDCGKERPSDALHAINSERFLHEGKLREIKPELRMLTKLSDDAVSMAYRMLKEAKAHHFALEEIYIKAMDFQKKEEQQKTLMEKVFS